MEEGATQADGMAAVVAMQTAVRVDTTVPSRTTVVPTTATCSIGLKSCTSSSSSSLSSMARLSCRAAAVAVVPEGGRVRE